MGKEKLLTESYMKGEFQQMFKDNLLNTLFNIVVSASVIIDFFKNLLIAMHYAILIFKAIRKK